MKTEFAVNLGKKIFYQAIVLVMILVIILIASGILRTSTSIMSTDSITGL